MSSREEKRRSYFLFLIFHRLLLFFGQLIVLDQNTWLNFKAEVTEPPDIQAEDEFAVQGAVRVLKELSRDLTDSQVALLILKTFFFHWILPVKGDIYWITLCIQVPSIAPVILPDIYRIFCESERFTVRTRARAVEIFTTLTSMICTMGEVTKSTPSYDLILT